MATKICTMKHSCIHASPCAGPPLVAQCRRSSRKCLRWIGFVLLVATDVARALPAGFEDNPLAFVNGPMDITFASPNVILVPTKNGIVYGLNITAEDATPFEVLNIRDQLCNNGERGMQSVVVHPDFGVSNRYIYVYYTAKGDSWCQENYETGPWGQLSRYLLSTSYTIDPTTEEVLFRTARQEFRLHSSGHLRFGVDGKLYFTVGDSGARVRAVAQDLQSVLGKIIRLNDDGTIPDDNPFMSSGRAVRCGLTGEPPSGSPSDAVCGEIYAYGLRNPFKFVMDPNSATSVRFLIGDVGGQTWEELNLGGADYAGANYGWPDREGPCKGNGNGGNNVETCWRDDDYQDPEHWYLHRGAEGGGCVAGSAIVPNGIWPQQYDGAILFAEYVFHDITLLTPDVTAYCRNPDICPDRIPTSSYTNSSFHSYQYPVALQFGPYGDTQALYYAARRADQTSNIRRISYVGGSNVAPVAVLSTTSPVAPIGQSMTFDASNSTDADGDALTFDWDFGDNTTTSTGADRKVTHAFTAAGVYIVTVTVSDTAGAHSTESIPVTVGTPPILSLVSPIAGTTFAVGDVFTLRAVATTINDTPLPDANFSWEVLQHHDTHTHPFLTPTVGNNLTLYPSPEPEDFLASTNSYLEIIVTATDANGLQSVASRNVLPKTVPLSFDTVPSGIALVIFDFTIYTPATIMAWESQILSIAAVNNSTDNTTIEFAYWSDGGPQTHEIQVQGNDTTAGAVLEYVAYYSVNGEVEDAATVTEAPSWVPSDATLDAPSVRPSASSPDMDLPTSGGNSDNMWTGAVRCLVVTSGLLWLSV